MIKHLWEQITFYCIHGHEEPVPMKVMSGTTQFYACPRYMLKDEEHPDGHESGEPGCANRISFALALKIVDRFGKIVEDDTEAGDIVDYTNMRFSLSGVDVQVLKYTPTDVRLGVLNRKALL